MIRRIAPVRASLLASILALVGLTLAGCPSDPYDPQTWIEKLDDNDPREVQNAVTQLQRLKDPVAIAPLARTWDKQNRPSSVLRVIVDLAAGTESGKEGEGDKDKDKDKDKREPHWEDAVEPLRLAVSGLDDSDQRTIENAIIGADALGMSKDKDSIPTLIQAAQKSMPLKSKGQRARLAAVRALGRFGNEPTSVDALIKVLDADAKDQPPELFAAAAEALADARSPKAIQPLLETFYKIPLGEIIKRSRLALIATGKPVIPEVMKIYQGEHKEFNKLPKEKLAIVQIMSVQLLADLQAKNAVKPLIDGLKKNDDSRMQAVILDSLKRLGDSSAASAILAYATDEKSDDAIRHQAIDAYSYLTTSTDALPALAKFIKDDGAEESVRLAAGISYGRLTRATSSYDPLVYMIGRYRKEADKNDGKRKQAEKVYESARKAFEAADKKALAEPKNEKLQKAAEKAKAKMEEEYQKSQAASGEVAGYRRFQRTFEQNLMRAHVGVLCKEDPKCYIGILDKNADSLGKELDKYITDWKDWSADEKTALKLAAVERALIELSKMGEGGRSVMDKILTAVDSSERIVRQGCLLVMFQNAKLPCEKCVSRLDAIITKQEGDSTLSQLTDETRAARNYFLWGGT